MSASPAPGFEKHPSHRVDLSAADRRVTARVGDIPIADSSKCTLVDENRHTPVYYFPREDVRMELLERTDHSTYCPFKGHASYYSILLPDQKLENAVWTYEDPYAETLGLKDLVAFYGDRVEVREA